MGANMALVPWLEDALATYEKNRANYPTLSDFAGELTGAIAAIPVDSCRAATSPDVALVGISRDRAVVGWIGDHSPFKARGLLVGDTVVAIDGDSVSAGGMMVPTRQLYLDFSQHLPAELATLTIGAAATSTASGSRSTGARGPSRGSRHRRAQRWSPSAPGCSGRFGSNRTVSTQL